MPSSGCIYFFLRFRYVGSYKNRQCKIELRDVVLEDGGKWKCEVESRKDWCMGRDCGEKVTQDIDVEVLPSPWHSSKAEKETDSMSIIE